MAESNASKLANNILTDGKFDATDVVGNITSTGIDDNATSTAITIDSSQNIGIGTISPSTMLHINQGGEPPAEGMLILEANSASRQLRIQPPTNADNGFIDYKGGNLTFLDDGTEVARFQGSTGFEVIGTIKVTGGIYLGGTAAENLLDDYEEGTWTPSYTATGITYSTQVGKYTKIGDIVIVSFIVATSNTTSISGSGNLNVTGLPFTAEATNPRSSMAVMSGRFSSNQPNYGVITTSSSVIELRNAFETNTQISDMGVNASANQNVTEGVLIYNVT